MALVASYIFTCALTEIADADQFQYIESYCSVKIRAPGAPVVTYFGVVNKSKSSHNGAKIGRGVPDDKLLVIDDPVNVLPKTNHLYWLKVRYNTHHCKPKETQWECC